MASLCHDSSACGAASTAHAAPTTNTGDPHRRLRMAQAVAASPRPRAHSRGGNVSPVTNGTVRRSPGA